MENSHGAKSAAASDFFEQPILNSPYDYPLRHWQLDENGQPTQTVTETRRKAEFMTPIPTTRKRTVVKSGRQDVQTEFVLNEGKNISSENQNYDLTSQINEIRSAVDTWRDLPKSLWNVTPVTARLLDHWRHHEFSNQRPFFCQIEAAETLIWLTEVAPKSES